MPRNGDHFSGTPIARRLKRPTRSVFVAPGQRSEHIWSCCRWGLPCRPCHHERGALLPHHFTLARNSRQRAVGRKTRAFILATAYRVLPTVPGGIFLLHFPSDCSAWTLSSTVPCAVRTFLVRPSGANPIGRTRSPLGPRRRRDLSIYAGLPFRI